MDKASFEIVGNIGKVEIKDIKGGKKLAILSIATSERWKRDDGEWNEKTFSHEESSSPRYAERTYWHRIVVFPQTKVALIEAAVQKGTRVRLVGQVRPSSYEDAKGITRYVIEFVVTGFGQVEILARGKPRPTDSDQNLNQRGKAAAAGEHLDAA